MSPLAKMEYLVSPVIRYRQASGKQKRAILNEFCLNAFYHRQHAIRPPRTYKQSPPPPRRKPGRASRYHTPANLAALKYGGLAANRP